MTTRKPLRILMILRAPIGGLYRNVMDLTETLSLRGHQLGIIADSRIEDARTLGRLEALSIPPALGFHRLPISRLFGPEDFSSMRAIRRLVRELDADVLHGHGAKGGLNARLSRIGSKGRISAYTPHGGVLHYGEKTLLGKALRLVERGLLSVSDAIVFESAYAKREFEHQIGKVPCLAPVALNGLADDEFDPMPDSQIDHDFAFVGEFRAVKGVDLLLRALAPARRLDGTPATLILGGKGPEEDRLRRIVDELELSDRVTFAGVQKARDIFGRGACAVMPSIIESLPYVALEAASGSRPLIATDVGGVNEIFGPTSGSLLTAGDEAGLRTALQQFLDNPEAAKTEMQQRFTHVQANFSVHRMTDVVEEAYYQALDNRSVTKA